MDFTLWEALWFVIIGLALFVFTTLDGFDLGVGMLLPFFSKNKDVKRQAVFSIWPIWDGNELFGLLAGGALLAIFPVVFGNLLSGMYPYVILLLVCLMYRSVAFEMWFHNHGKRVFWERIMALISLGTIVLIGAVLGNTIHGFSLKPDGAVVGGLLAILNPYSLLTGLLLAGFAVLHGAVWLTVKLKDEGEASARAALRPVWLAVGVLALGWFVWSALGYGGASKPLFLVFGLLALAALGGLRLLAGAEASGVLNARLQFWTSVLSLGFFWLSVGALQFPVLIRGLPGFADITISSAGASESSLVFLGIAAPIGVVIALAYTLVVYRVFKGKVPDKIGETGHY